MRQFGDFRERAWPRESVQRAFEVLHGFSPVLDALDGHLDSGVLQWHSVDESLFGLQLIVPSAGLDAPVRAGELIAFRPTGSDASWVLGVMRWVRAEDGRIRVGVYKLGSDARVLRGRAALADGFAEFSFALLPPLPGLGRGARCVLPAGVYAAPGIYVDLGDGEELLAARESPRGNHLVEWFEVAEPADVPA